MNNARRTSSVFAVIVAMISVPVDALSQSYWDNPEPWWPSKWGEGDEAGASNLVTNESVLAAAALIRRGEIFELGRVMEAEMPMRGVRVYINRISSNSRSGATGSGLVDRYDFITSELTQVGTQVDGLGHVSIQTSFGRDAPPERRFYNGFLEQDVVANAGLRHLGIENMKPLFTRGVLIDVARSRGRMLESGEEILLDDMARALEMQGMSLDDIRRGDVVLFNTGWGRLWKVDNARFNQGTPGIGMEVARWLIERDVILVGSDTWNTEVVPNPDPTMSFAVHNEFMTKNGVYIQENLYLEELSAQNAFEFVYIYNRVPLKGATGSPGSPIAIR